MHSGGNWIDYENIVEWDSLCQSLLSILYQTSVSLIEWRLKKRYWGVVFFFNLSGLLSNISQHLRTTSEMQICMGINPVLLNLPVEPPIIMIRAKIKPQLNTAMARDLFFSWLGDWTMQYARRSSMQHDIKLLSFIHLWSIFGDACIYHLDLSSNTPSLWQQLGLQSSTHTHQTQTTLYTWARISRRVCVPSIEITSNFLKYPLITFCHFGFNSVRVSRQEAKMSKLKILNSN